MVATPNIKDTQTRALAIYNFPTEFLKATQVRVQIASVKNVGIKVTQLRTLVLVKGRTENRHLRAWGFTLDGHDMWAIRLGETETLVYDRLSRTWYVWKGEGLPYWRAHQGIPWVGMAAPTYAAGAVCDVVAGDDDQGILWQLRPQQAYDDNALDNGVSYFDRVVTGALPVRMRDSVPCDGVYLAANMGEPAYTGASVTLNISDDKGKSWWSAGSVEVVDGEDTAEIAWRSLGVMQAPGRLFSIEDDGAVNRIDGLEMPE